MSGRPFDVARCAAWAIGAVGEGRTPSRPGKSGHACQIRRGGLRATRAIAAADWPSMGSSRQVPCLSPADASAPMAPLARQKHDPAAGSQVAIIACEMERADVSQTDRLRWSLTQSGAGPDDDMWGGCGCASIRRAAYKHTHTASHGLAATKRGAGVCAGCAVWPVLGRSQPHLPMRRMPAPLVPARLAVVQIGDVLVAAYKA